MSTAIYDRRFKGYWDEFLVEEELLKLKIINGTKVDHGAQGYKDGADTVAGATYQCVTHLNTEMEVEIEIWDGAFHDDEIMEKVSVPANVGNSVGNIPPDIEEWLFEAI